MKIINVKRIVGRPVRRIVVELDDGEELLAFRCKAHYQLGQPIEDIVPGHVISEAVSVSWCPVEQKWV